MKYKLINPINPKYSTIETILTNRHIPLAEVAHYLNTTDEDINKVNVLVIVDCDCDGFTSAALLINYLHDLVPSWVESNLK